MNEMSQILTNHAEAVLFFAVLVEQIGLPFPAAPLLVAAGAVTVDGSGFPTTAMGVTVTACLLPDWMWFYVGRRGGRRVLQYFLPESSWTERTERFLARYGVAAVVAAKFVPGLSLIIPPLAGAARIGTGKFLFFDVFGSFLYAAVYLSLGVLFSKEVADLLDLLDQLGVGSVVLAFLVASIVAVCVYLRRRKTAEARAALSIVSEV